MRLFDPFGHLMLWGKQLSGNKMEDYIQTRLHIGTRLHIYIQTLMAVVKTVLTWVF